MRETIRDFTLAVAALAALFAAFQSWTTGRELAAVREDLAELRGQWETTIDVLLEHINAHGLHGGGEN